MNQSVTEKWMYPVVFRERKHQHGLQFSDPEKARKWLDMQIISTTVGKQR